MSLIISDAFQIKNPGCLTFTPSPIFLEKLKSKYPLPPQYGIILEKMPIRFVIWLIVDLVNSYWFIP